MTLLTNAKHWPWPTPSRLLVRHASRVLAIHAHEGEEGQINRRGALSRLTAEIIIARALACGGRPLISQWLLIDQAAELALSQGVLDHAFVESALKIGTYRLLHVKSLCSCGKVAESDAATESCCCIAAKRKPSV